MSELIINNNIIEEPIKNILDKVKSELFNGKLNTISQKGDSVKVTCPFHSNGKELNADCYVLDSHTKKDNFNKDIIYGTFHCFACGCKGGLGKFIGECFDRDEDYGNNWLISNFGHSTNSRTIEIEDIDLSQRNQRVKTLDESILDDMQSYHPYMDKRKLSREICERFKIKYDNKDKCIVFPVWDSNDNLVFLTKRKVDTKMFIIPPDVKKPVYLLNHIINNNIKEVLVCESQINCLYAWSLGYPAIALFGTGDEYQYELLKHSGIYHYILCLDGDSAGDKGIDRFINHFKNKSYIDIVDIPRGKDLNDLEEDEVKNLINNYFYSDIYKK